MTTVQMLVHPLARGLDIDDPRTTEVWRLIVQEKGFLKRLYEDWYGQVKAALPSGSGLVLELGSGAGFLSEFIPGLITSEVLECSGVKVALDGQALPFRDGSLRAVVMTDVLHHLPRVRAFLSEAARCVRPGGSLIMVEPWVTAWSRVVYTHLHPEPLLPAAQTWEFPSSGPVSGANIALPWILFERDRCAFEHEFPDWRIDQVTLGGPFRYLLSGGLTRLRPVPGWTYAFWSSLEERFRPWMRYLAMFALIVLKRRDGSR
jgi:SAM-dependent methyltransferase